MLEADPTAPSATFSLDEATYPGRTDAIQITAYGRAADGRDVQVVLNIIHGRIDELEIRDGTWNRTHGAMPDPQTMEWTLCTSCACAPRWLAQLY